MKTRDEILTHAANGNPSAIEFLRAFARRAHWVDDLADKRGDEWGDPSNPIADGPSPAMLAYHEQEWLLCLSGNQFFLTHRPQLVPAMILALNAWVDAPDFAIEQAAVLKAQWHEVVWLVAWLTGGWSKLRLATMGGREFDVEEPENLERKPCGCGPVEICTQCSAAAALKEGT